MSERLVNPQLALATAHDKAVHDRHLGENIYADGLFLGYLCFGNPWSEQIDRPGFILGAKRAQFNRRAEAFGVESVGAMGAAVDSVFAHAQHATETPLTPITTKPETPPPGAEDFNETHAIYVARSLGYVEPSETDVVTLCEGLAQTARTHHQDRVIEVGRDPILSYKPEQIKRIATIVGGMIWVPSAVRNTA